MNLIVWELVKWIKFMFLEVINELYMVIYVIKLIRNIEW